MDARTAILNYQYAERIKSQLIIAFKMLEKLSVLSGEEWSGGEKMLLSYLESVSGEIRMAQSQKESSHLTEVDRKMAEAIGHLKLFEQPELYKALRDCLTRITTSDQLAMEELEVKNLL